MKTTDILGILGVTILIGILVNIIIALLSEIWGFHPYGLDMPNINLKLFLTSIIGGVIAYILMWLSIEIFND